MSEISQNDNNVSLKRFYINLWINFWLNFWLINKLCIDLKAAFDCDVVNKLTKEVVETIIGANTYQHSKVNFWSNNIVDQVLQQLIKINKSYKYIGYNWF